MYTCFVDFVKAHDHVPLDKLWAVLPEYDVRSQVLAAVKPLYKLSEVCVRANGMKTKIFSVSVGLQQSCVFSPLLFIIYIYMDKTDRDSFFSTSITFVERNVRCLMFAVDLALLSSNKNDLQCALYWFSAVCLDAGMKISTAKTEITCVYQGTLTSVFSIQME